MNFKQNFCFSHLPISESEESLISRLVYRFVTKNMIFINHLSQVLQILTIGSLNAYVYLPVASLSIILKLRGMNTSDLVTRLNCAVFCYCHPCLYYYCRDCVARLSLFSNNKVVHYFAFFLLNGMPASNNRAVYLTICNAKMVQISQNLPLIGNNG